MAEGGDAEEQRRARRVRRMCPQPPRPFQAYSGPPVAEGQVIRTFMSFCMPCDESSFVAALMLSRFSVFACRVDCAFDPYSEHRIAMSVDIQVVCQGADLQSLNEGPFVYISRVSLNSQYRLLMPFRRSTKSVSTSFCSDGARLAWSGLTNFNVYDLSTEVRRSLDRQVRCGAFSRDGSRLALLSIEGSLLRITINNSESFECLVSSCFLLDHHPDNRNIFYFNHSPCYLLWSPCGRYLGVSTGFGELIIIRVNGMFETNIEHVPMILHDCFAEISNPRAYDFSSVTRANQQLTTFALGNDRKAVRLYQFDDNGPRKLLQQTDALQTDEEEEDGWVINCLRFSNAEDLLAVAMSNGVINLLDSETLCVVRRLQPVVFTFQLPTDMPFYHGFSSLAFACSDNFLAAGATDGLVRVWCVRRPTGPLKALCRTAIRSRCKLEDLCELPLPPRILHYLTEVAF